MKQSGGDGLFEEEEYEAGYVVSDDYVAWDIDSEVGLTEDELSTGIGEEDVFGESDTDGDGLLSEDEFGTSV